MQGIVSILLPIPEITTTATLKHPSDTAESVSIEYTLLREFDLSPHFILTVKFSSGKKVILEVKEKKQMSRKNKGS